MGKHLVLKCCNALIPVLPLRRAFYLHKGNCGYRVMVATDVTDTV